MSELENDRFGHFFWEDITDRALAVVNEKVDSINARLRADGARVPTDCGLACEAWVRAFRTAGVPVRQVEGNYYRGSGRGLAEWPTSSDHVWLIVDGFLFDPTASQFADGRHPIEPRWYRVGPPA